MSNEKITAPQNEQQLKVAIIDKIIKLLANEKLTIEETDKILYETRKKINQQAVQFLL